MGQTDSRSFWGHQR